MLSGDWDRIFENFGWRRLPSGSPRGEKQQETSPCRSARVNGWPAYASHKVIGGPPGGGSEDCTSRDDPGGWGPPEITGASFPGPPPLFWN
ncbi:Hypothetical protein NTJ_11463 [Nesidiocoris tenuis]|uniref:Uncharacterized protein n=1 Tax=Nesidiocoris tenuis TaxID=355587 RepID=A0ABN7B2K0_9HEMI|nr:Hypothetical protein NTJ_11463 [Nesidiocoris tenuis]